MFYVRSFEAKYVTILESIRDPSQSITKGPFLQKDLGQGKAMAQVPGHDLLAAPRRTSIMGYDRYSLCEVQPHGSLE